MKRILSRLALLTTCAALFLPGLIFYPHAQHVFWATEGFSSRLLVPLALVLTLLDLSLTPSAARYDGDRGAKGWAEVLFGLWFLSAAFSQRKDLAAEQLSLWLCYPAIFYAVHLHASQTSTRGRLIFFILSAGALQSLYGLVQSSGLEPGVSKAIRSFSLATGLPSFGFEALNWAVTFAGRAGAFLGNPNFLGGHLALLLPLSLALALDDRGGWRRWLRWGGAALILAGLVVSQTRGAWAGAALGSTLSLWLCHRRMPGLLRRNRKTLAAFAGLGLLSLALFFSQHSQNLGRLAGVFKGDQELSRRAFLMKASAQLALRHPFLGVGPGNFRIHFPSVQARAFTPAELGTQPYIYSEHAHNDLIQMAAESGIPAALAYLALLLTLFATLYKGIGRPDARAWEREEGGDPLLTAGALGGLVALTIHGLANFPFLIAPTQLTAWALAALALRTSALPRATDSPSPLPAPHLFYAGAVLALLTAYHAGRNLHKDAIWWVGEGELKLGNAHKAREVIFAALAVDRKEDRLWYHHGKAQIDEEFKINGNGSLKEAIRLNENHMEARWLLGRTSVDIKEFKQAEEALLPVARLAPNLGDIWEPLAAALYMQGKFEEAARAYDWALLRRPANAAELLDNKAAALGNLKDYKGALAALEESERLNPGRAKVHINKAITYLKMGLPSLAKLSLQAAKKLDPRDSQVKELMKVIK